MKSGFRDLVDYCENNSQSFGDVLLDIRRTSEKMYKIFLDLAMPAIALKTFKESMIVDKLSKNITESEEAFALLVFENNFERWKWQAEQEHIKSNGGSISNGEAPDVLYQKKVKKRRDDRDTAGKWLSIGLERFNELAKGVRKARSERLEYEERLFALYCDEDEQLELFSKRMKRKELDKERVDNKQKKVMAVNMLDINTV